MVEGYVYFLLARAVSRVKIGRTINIDRRFAEVRLISPIPLEMVGYVEGGAKMEARLHRQWAHLRHHGEWFTATPDLMSQLEFASLMAAWNRAGPEARDMFQAEIDGPVFDRARAAA